MEPSSSDANIQTKMKTESLSSVLKKRLFRRRNLSPVQPEQPQAPAVHDESLARTGENPLESPARLTHLEGLRGIAAFAVLLQHLLLAFLPVAVMRPVDFQWEQFGVLQWLVLTPLSLFYDGSFAVRIFFVHSGLVLAYRYVRNGRQPEVLVSSALGRYFRLTLPMACSVYLAYLLLATGYMWNKEVAELSGSGDWLSKNYAMVPDFWIATRQAFWDSYFNYDSSISYNTNLWTIRAELFGSYFVYAFLILFGRVSSRSLFYLIALCATYNTELSGFVVGMILCESYFYLKVYRWNKPSHLRSFSGLSLLLLGATVGAYVSPVGPLFSRLEPYALPYTLPVIKTFGATLVVVGVTLLPSVQKFLNLKLVQYLGQISYALYLVHIPLICSFGSLFFLLFNTTFQWGYGPSAIASSLLTIMLSFLLAHLLWKRVDQPAIVLAKRIANRLK